MGRRVTHDAVGMVAIIISIGIAVAINLITFGVLWAALNSEAPGISDNATQILTGWGGGIVGLLGGYLGHELAARRRDDNDEDDTSNEMDITD